jgi:hypothetical protein
MNSLKLIFFDALMCSVVDSVTVPALALLKISFISKEVFRGPVSG